MDALLARLERTFLGRLAIERLTTYVVGGMAVMFVLLYMKPELYPQLTLDPYYALKQPWRFVTYFFLPTSRSLMWILFSLYWTWLVGTNLEHEWGAFKLNVYYILGALGTTAVAWLTGMPQANFWLNTSLFFAFATLFPNYEILLFFIVPIRVKWLALLMAGYIGFSFFEGDLGVKAAIGIAFGNYFLFFAGHLVALARGQQLQMKQAARRSSMRQAEEDAAPPSGGRVCAICGATQEGGADIRVCSCEKCGGVPRELCLEHARNH